MDPIDTTATVEPGLGIDSSVLSTLRRQRAKLGAGADPIRLDLPGYDGNLVAQFRWVPANTLAATSKSVQAIKNQTAQNIAAAADAIAATNNEILVKVYGKLESLEHEGQPVTFSNGEGLCVALGLPKPRSTRECVEAVLGNEYALLSLAVKVMEWLENTSAEVDGAHLGE